MLPATGCFAGNDWQRRVATALPEIGDALAAPEAGGFVGVANLAVVLLAA